MYIVVLCLFFAASSATSARSPVRSGQQRIVGGELTTIDRWPSLIALLSYDCHGNIYRQACGSAIINKRSVLTAAHCIDDFVPIYYHNMRAGSSYASSGGTVYVASKLLFHSEYNSRTGANDIGILYSASDFEFNNLVTPGSIANRGYYLADNESVWAVGWGVYNITTSYGSEQLREVNLYTINWQLCRDRYKERQKTVDENMLCVGILDVGGKDQCHGDSGSPLYHNNVVVGVCSWGDECGNARYPGVNTLVSPYADWIADNSNLQN